MSFYKKIVLSIFMVLSFVGINPERSEAQSGSFSLIYFEPHFGLNFRNRESTLGYGLKIGTHIASSNLFFGIGGGMHNLQSVAGDDNGDGELTLAGAFVGYNNKAWRFWAAYDFLDTLEWKGSQYEYTGSGLSIGLGVFLTPTLSLNLEYRSNEYDELEINGTTQTLSNNVFDDQGYVSLSFMI